MVSRKLRISVIIPTLNEEDAIGHVLKEVPWKVVDEVIVVDSSYDATAKIAESLGAKVIFERREGYGRALQSGVTKAKGDIVVFIDGDHSYDPQDIYNVVEPILNGKYDVVLGDRLRGSMLQGSMVFLNRFGNLLISLIFSIVFRKMIGDTQCGLRAIRKKFLNGLFYENYGMPYVTEQLIKLINRGARVGNVLIKYRPRIGTTKLCAWTDGFKILKVILKGMFLWVKV